eukprot:7198149-Pyramimonas_sp.AAC.1
MCRVSPPAHPETISRGVGESGTTGSMQLRGCLQKNTEHKKRDAWKFKMEISARYDVVVFVVNVSSAGG